VLVAYDGRVYDVSNSFLWMGGRHFWLRAGRDLSGAMIESPHGEEILDRVPCVGLLEEG
jgi:predicted heme/steroid binding protein